MFSTTSIKTLKAFEMWSSESIESQILKSYSECERTKTYKRKLEYLGHIMGKRYKMTTTQLFCTGANKIKIVLLVTSIRNE